MKPMKSFLLTNSSDVDERRVTDMEVLYRKATLSRMHGVSARSAASERTPYGPSSTVKTSPGIEAPAREQTRIPFAICAWASSGSTARKLQGVYSHVELDVVLVGVPRV